MQMSSAYALVHRAARKTVGATCERCGSGVNVQAALRPDVPAERLVLDLNGTTSYSTDVADYFALCVPCHRRLDLVELRPRCRRGHEYTPANTSIKTEGARRCLTCHREDAARRLLDPKIRAAKNEADREYRKRKPMTPEQKARKVALQRLRRQALI